MTFVFWVEIPSILGSEIAAWLLSFFPRLSMARQRVVV